MPRDGAGNYTLPPGNPVFPGTVIEADWANPTMSDIATALTDSLSRTGSGGMLVPFLNADGAVGAPGMSWINEPSSGWYRAALNDFWYSVGNENIFRITKTGIELAAGKTALNISSFTAVQDADPAPNMKQGQQWYESDTGMFAMRYVNPDLTETYISLAAAGGDFAPLVGGQIPVAFMPSGSVLQVVTATDAGSLSTSLVLANLNVSVVPITPKSANSKFVVDVRFSSFIQALAGVNTSGFFQIRDVTGAAYIGSELSQAMNAATPGNGLQLMGSIAAVIPNAALTPRTFTLHGRTSNAAAQVGAFTMTWIITEIQN